MCLRPDRLIFGAFSLLNPQAIHPRAKGGAKGTEWALLFAQAGQLPGQIFATNAVFLAPFRPVVGGKPAPPQLFGALGVASSTRLKK